MHLGVVVLLLPLCFCVHQDWIVGVGAATGGGTGVNLVSGGGSESVEHFVHLLRSRGIGKIRLHDADSTMLHAISSSSGREASIEVIVGMRNDEIVGVGESEASAKSWVARNVVPYFPATNITAIAVGNEVLSSEQGGDDGTIVQSLVPAMRNLFGALSEVGLEKQIKVSAPLSARVLSSRFPPSSATFSGEKRGSVMELLLDFLSSSGSYFMLNLYPLDLQHDGVGVDVGQSEVGFSGGGLEDSQTGRRYYNMVDVLTDAVSVAMSSLGYPKPGVLGIDMELSGTSVSSPSMAVLIDHTPKGAGGYFDPKFGADLEINLPLVEQKVKVEAFSSRRFLSDVLKARQENSGTRRRLGPDKSWCVAKSSASTDSLQSALDWACGTGGANCQPIQVGQSCYIPDTIVQHASYAFNAYYQKRSWASGSCDFGGIAQTTTSDPSTASCLYSSSTSANGTPSTPTGTTVPTSVASRLAWDRCRFVLTSFILVFLIKRTLSDLRI